MNRTLKVAILALAFATAACTVGGGSAPPGTVASTASPAAADVAAAFLAAARSPDFSARIDITTRGTANGQPFTGTGEQQTIGSSSEEHDVIHGNGTTTKSADIVIDGVDYHQDGSGPWVKEPGRETDPLQRMTSLDDLGPVQKGGQTVEHLQPPKSFAFRPSDFGFATGTVSNLSDTVDFYALPDGTPSSMEQHATFDQGGVHFTIFVASTFTDIGTPVTVDAPASPWALYRSAQLGVSFAYPSGWVPGSKSLHLFADPSGYPRIWMSSVSLGSKTPLAAATASVLRGEGLSFTGRASHTTKVAGTLADVITEHAKISGKPIFLQQAIMVVGTRLLAVFYASKPGHEKEDADAFQQALSTVQFTSPQGAATA